MREFLSRKEVKYTIGGLVLAAFIAFVSYEAVYSWRLDHQSEPTNTEALDSASVLSSAVTDTTATDSL